MEPGEWGLGMCLVGRAEKWYPVFGILFDHSESLLLNSGQGLNGKKIAFP